LTPPLVVPTAELLRRRTIRGRLARILALPLVAVMVLLAVVAIDDTSAYRAASDTDRAATLLVQVGSLVDALQIERGVASGVLGGDVSFQAEVAPARSQVDTATRQVNALINGPGGPAVAAAMSHLTSLAVMRGQVDAHKVTRATAYDYYTSRIADLNAIDVGIESSADDQLRRAVTAIQALRDLKEYASQERAFLNGVFAAGGFGPGEYRTFSTIHAQALTAQARFEQFATPVQQAMLAAALDTGAAREAAFFEARALDAVNAPFVVSPQSWWSANTTLIDDLRAAETALGLDISSRAQDLQRAAAIRLAVLGVLAAVSAIGAALLLISAVRSITRPLAALAAEALTVATIRLPKAMERLESGDPDEEVAPPPRVTAPMRSSAEIAAVADALDSAQATAFQLATEQARLRRSTSESLANLGRRNQNLLRRQLGFITQLEREETDPAGLANLFELDHLATRMRRNAESLLVLVGESSPRTWSEALPVADVLRAAISEVEDYRRVSLRRVDDAYVGGAFVAGIAHMIAELVENGLNFSPPDVDVEIQGRMLPGRYLIGITDQGLGMDPEDMGRANARLRGEESFLSAPTRYLGHYVVGHLARQMGVDVEIGPSPVTGVTARVTLPGNVLAAAPAITGRPAATRPGDGRPAPLAIDAVAVPVVEYVTAGGRPTTSERPITGVRPGGPVAGSRPAAANGVGPTSNGGGATGSFSAAAPVPTRDPGAPRPYRPTAGRDDIAAQVAHGRGERTRNGLLKRVPRPRRPSGTTGLESRPDHIEPDSTPTEAAAELRSRLTSLRAGVARGEHDHAIGGGDRPSGAPGSTSESGPEAERSTHAR
jgi:signal transduction histidine kinase